MDFENYNLPEEIIISCLKNHNNGYYFQGKAIVFMDFKDNKNIPLIIQGYQDTINIRMAETAYYYEIDKNRNEHFWINGLKNIMVFEDKIHMGHKKHTMDKILKYLFKIQNIDYNEDFLDELTNYLWDLNSKIVQEFNELQGFISSTLIKKNEVKNIIYNFYKKQYNDPVTKTLAIAHNLYDSMMILGLGGIMTPHKDPYNLKGVIDQWLKLLMDNKITINFSDLIKIFEEDYQEKFFWKNTINGIHSRWILMFNYIPKYLNSDKIGHEISQEIHYFNEIKNKQYLLKRLTGLLKKNHDEDEENKEYHSLDDELNSYINELYSYDNYEKSYQWLLKYEDFLLNYLDNVRIKGNDFRENLIKKIIHWKFYE